MMKWIALAAGLFLFTNGIYTRTFSYADPESHCFYMDLIHVRGCFGSAAVPQMIVWSNLLIGGALVLGCLLYVQATRRRAK
jgi:hypothetical protein